MKNIDQYFGTVSPSSSLCIDGEVHNYTAVGSPYWRTFRTIRRRGHFPQAAREYVQTMACSKCLKRAIMPTGQHYLGQECVGG